jgi:GT2 family glycosyltransferase
LSANTTGASTDTATELPIQIVLPVHNRREQTERFIDQLKSQTDQNYRLVLIDDGSSDGTWEMAQRALPGAAIIRGNGSLWWAGGLQRGVDWLVADGVPTKSLVLLINNDTEFSPDLLATARRAMGKQSRTLLHAQRCESGFPMACLVGVAIDWRRLLFTDTSNIADVDCFSTRGLFLRLEDLLELGRFHPRLLPHYLSDFEFTLRARRAGYTFLSEPAVRLLHGPNTQVSGDQVRGIREYAQHAVSKRSPDNPLHWTMFLLMACPRRYLPANVLRIWYRFFRGMGRAVTRRA